MTSVAHRETETVSAGGDDGVRTGSAGLTAAVLVALALFALIGIGGPLVGHGVFAATDALGQESPYRDFGVGPDVKSLYQNDTYDAVIPNTLLVAEGLRSGEIPAWNPYILGGVPLTSTPNLGTASPLTLPYYLLPGSLAPGYVKLVEIIAAAAGAFLFGRRVGLGRPAALVGGLVFASSAFLIAWTNWPQTRTAAIIGFVFWAAERLVQRGRLLDAVLLAAAVAAMLFGGFPAVTGYTLLFAGLYLVTRVVAEHRRGRWGADVRVLLTAGAGLVAGIALAAVQLLPFVSSLAASLVVGREQAPTDHLPAAALLTALAPEALGTVNPARPPAFFLDQNFVESLSYVGAVALVLVVIAVASPRRARHLLPKGVWLFLVIAVGLTVVMTYGGGPVLAAAQKLPNLFASNYVGRVRSVLGFLVAVLAATGFEVVLRGRGARSSRRVRAYQVAVWVVVAAGGAWIWSDARTLARATDTEAADGVGRLYLLDLHVVQALALVAVGLVATAFLWWGRGPRFLRFGAAALLPVLITAQALTLVRQYWPDSDVDTFYPVTDVQQYLRTNLGHDRYAFALGAMGTGADAPLRLRALNGHAFVSQPVADLIEALPGNQFGNPPTLPVLEGRPEVATSPVLDRLGTRFFVTSPLDQVFGDPSGDVAGDGTSAELTPERTVSAPIVAGRPLRAVVVTPAATAVAPTDATTRVDVVVRGVDGAEVARGSRVGTGLMPQVPFTIPLPEVPTRAGMTAEVTLHGPQALAVTAVRGAPAVTTVRAVADGLRLAYAGSSVIYERLAALPRIHWADQVVAEADPQKQVALVAGGTLTPQQVLLDRSGPSTGSGPARLDVVEDGSDAISVRVDAAGGGYLVVADALQTGWTVQLDGRDAPLLAADHGGVTVAVPAGQHTVTWRYGSAPDRLGGVVTGLAAMAMLAVLVVEARRVDLRRRRPGGGARYDPTARPGPTWSPSSPESRADSTRP